MIKFQDDDEIKLWSSIVSAGVCGFFACSKTVIVKMSNIIALADNAVESLRNRSQEPEL